MPTLRHNAIRDIFGQLLTEMCPNMGIEPMLQPLSGETYHHRSTSTKDGARLDIRAQNIWNKSQSSTYFNVRVFNSHALSNRTSSTDACYRREEQEKRRVYEKRILEVEHGTFTPLVCLQVEAVDHLPCLPSRGLQVSSPRNMDNRTAVPSASSDADCHSACLTQQWPASVPQDRHIDLHDTPLYFIRAEAQLCD